MRTQGRFSLFHGAAMRRERGRLSGNCFRGGRRGATIGRCVFPRAGCGNPHRLSFQLFANQVGERVDESRIAIQRGDAAVGFYADLVGEFFVEDVEFIKRLDVVGDKADWNRQDLLDALRRQFTQLSVCRRFQPFDRPDLALEAEMNGAETAELLRNQSNSLFNVLEIRVAVFDITLRDAVSAEEQVNTTRVRVGEFFGLSGDLSGERLDVSLVRVPLPDVMSAHALEAVALFHQRLEIFEARPGRRNGELRIERQQDQFINAVAGDLINRLLGARTPVTHPDINTGLGAAPGEFFAQGGGLLFGDAPQRRSAADLLVIARGLFVTSRRDQPRQRLLHRANRQPHNLRVGEEVEEERAHVGQRFRPAQVEEENTNLHMRDRETERRREGETEREGDRESLCLSVSLSLLLSVPLSLRRFIPSPRPPWSPLRGECICGWPRRRPILLSSRPEKGIRRGISPRGRTVPTLRAGWPCRRWWRGRSCKSR